MLLADGNNQTVSELIPTPVGTPTVIIKEARVGSVSSTNTSIGEQRPFALTSSIVLFCLAIVVLFYSFRKR